MLLLQLLQGTVGTLIDILNALVIDIVIVIAIAIVIDIDIYFDIELQACLQHLEEGEAEQKEGQHETEVGGLSEESIVKRPAAGIPQAEERHMLQQQQRQQHLQRFCAERDPQIARRRLRGAMTERSHQEHQHAADVHAGAEIGTMAGQRLPDDAAVVHQQRQAKGCQEIEIVYAQQQEEPPNYLHSLSSLECLSCLSDLL